MKTCWRLQLDADDQTYQLINDTVRQLRAKDRAQVFGRAITLIKSIANLTENRDTILLNVRRTNQNGKTTLIITFPKDAEFPPEFPPETKVNLLHLEFGPEDQ